jgi:hypothetical protein
VEHLFGALLDWLRARISHEALVEIARADYGWKAEECAGMFQAHCKDGGAPLRFGLTRARR